MADTTEETGPNKPTLLDLAEDSYKARQKGLAVRLAKFNGPQTLLDCISKAIDKKDWDYANELLPKETWLSKGRKWAHETGGVWMLFLIALGVAITYTFINFHDSSLNHIKENAKNASQTPLQIDLRVSCHDGKGEIVDCSAASVDKAALKVQLEAFSRAVNQQVGSKEDQRFATVDARIGDLVQSIGYLGTLSGLFGVLVTAVVLFFSFKESERVNEKIDSLEQKHKELLGNATEDIKKSHEKSKTGIEESAKEAKTTIAAEKTGIEESVAAAKTEIKKVTDETLQKLKASDIGLRVQALENFQVPLRSTVSALRECALSMPPAICSAIPKLPESSDNVATKGTDSKDPEDKTKKIPSLEEDDVNS